MNRHTIAAIALSLLPSSSLLAGPLSPPLGPVASTHKTLSEVEPRTIINASNTPGDADSLFRISQPGSYYLTSNIAASANKHGIEIAASGVTLDLNGFELAGIPAMGPFDGIVATVTNSSNVTVRNGIIRNWGGDGIDFASTAAVSNVRIEGILTASNAVVGIRTSSQATIINCSARGNTSTGIIAGSNSLIINCTANGNATGFSTSFSCSIFNSSAYQNSGIGFSTSSANVISNCAAGFNTSHGFSIVNGSHITNCTALANSDGIRASFGCSILNNNCDQNVAGIRVTNTDNRIEGNHVTNGTTGYAIDGSNNLIIKNSSSDNTTDWIIAANNVYGPIINRTAPASAAFTGNSAPSTLGSTDPNANICH